jgi:indolepyruvate ferredoxin oxidoreductase beta subunit
MDNNIIVCGIGGQGVLFASNIIGMVAYALKWNVKVADLMGLGQTGGSVVSHIRISDGQIYAPRISKGQADIIVAFEKYEAKRYLAYLKKDGELLVNDYQLIPNTILYHLDCSSADSEMPGNRHCFIVPGYKLLTERKIRAKCLNTFFAGMIFSHLGIGIHELSDILDENRDRINDENFKSIKAGYYFKVNAKQDALI